MVNSNKHITKIVDLINRKPCCGSIRVEKTTLQPGDETDVEVTLKVGDSFGDVVHESVVILDPSPPEDLVLRTSVTAYPVIRVEELIASGSTVLLSTDSPRTIEFRASAYGTSDEPPIDLGRLELAGPSGVEVRWSGPKEEESSDQGLIVESRPLAVTLDPGGSTGAQATAIRLRDGETTIIEQVVNWEVVPPVSAAPKMVVLTAGRSLYRVLIRSNDSTPFQIARVECGVPGIQARSGGEAANQHVVTLNVEDPAAVGTAPGALTVHIDHPTQKTIDVPIVSVE